MNLDIDKSHIWFEERYIEQGFDCQRLYPNEELLRFLGRNFFKLKFDDRKKIKILEVGCGSCSNLWMISKEGFDAHGLDISNESLNLGKLMLDRWEVSANLQLGSMTEMPYIDNSMDLIVDIVSSYCLNSEMFLTFLKEVKRVLKPKGKFFMYTTSIESDTFVDFTPSVKIDKYTLDGIHNKNSSFYGNNYPFRFMDVTDMKQIFIDLGFEINYLETTTKTYKNLNEKFQYISFEATLI